MCVVSAVGDNWRERAPLDYPWINPIIYPNGNPPPQVSKEEFDKLKKEVNELKKLLRAAKKFDENTGQKDCEMENKIDFIKKVAKLVGVNMDGVLFNDGEKSS